MMTRRIGRVNRATREQCTRLIQMAGVTFGMCMQLKSCSGDVFFNDSPVTGGIVDTGDEWQLVSWTLPTSCMCYFLIFALQVFFLRGAVHGFAAMVIGGGFLLSGPLAWNHYSWLRSVAIRHTAVMLGFRFRWMVKPSLWMTWWFLRKEIIYLHAKFQDSGQAGAFMVDIETVYQALGECLTEDMSSWSCRSIGE